MAYRYIYVTFIRTRDGRIIYAKDYGLKAFKIKVKR
jgi:ketosteroid isomerase-like protein